MSNIQPLKWEFPPSAKTKKDIHTLLMPKSRSKTGLSDLNTHLTKLASIYKPVLRLEDWDINMSISHETPENGELANVEWHRRFPRAVITLYHPDIWEYDEPNIDTINKVILHEFLHLTVCPINRAVQQMHGRSDVFYDATEYVVEDLERIMYPLIRPMLRKAKLC